MKQGKNRFSYSIIVWRERSGNKDSGQITIIGRQWMIAFGFETKDSRTLKPSRLNASGEIRNNKREEYLDD